MKSLLRAIVRAVEKSTVKFGSTSARGLAAILLVLALVLHGPGLIAAIGG